MDYSIMNYTEIMLSLKNDQLFLVESALFRGLTLPNVENGIASIAGITTSVANWPLSDYT